MQPAAGAMRQPREYVPDRAESYVDDPDLGAAAMEADAEGGGGRQKATSGSRPPSPTGLMTTPKAKSLRATN